MPLAKRWHGLGGGGPRASRMLKRTSKCAHCSPWTLAWCQSRCGSPCSPSALGVVVDGKEFVLASELAALADDVVYRTEDSVDLEEERAWCVAN
eukprot:scaffold6264_cov107-Isochrysis_galbana.AAC.1